MRSFDAESGKHMAVALASELLPRGGLPVRTGKKVLSRAPTLHHLTWSVAHGVVSCFVRGNFCPFCIGLSWFESGPGGQSPAVERMKFSADG